MMLSAEEAATVRQLAEDHGLTVSDYIRQLIRREDEQRGQVLTAAVTKKKASKKR